VIKNIYEFAGDNKLFLEDKARETGRLFKDVAKEYHAAYVESKEDINNDH
jgi:hypothetical protein